MARQTGEKAVSTSIASPMIEFKSKIAISTPKNNLGKFNRMFGSMKCQKCNWKSYYQIKIFQKSIETDA